MKLEDVIKEVQQLKQDVARLRQRRIYQRDVVPKAIKQPHIDGIIIFRGLLANRPSDGSTEIQAYFATDNDTLYIWDDVSESWLSEAFS